MSPQEKMERPRPRTIRPASAFHGFPPGALVPGQAPPGVVPVMMPSPPAYFYQPTQHYYYPGHAPLPPAAAVMASPRGVKLVPIGRTSPAPNVDSTLSNGSGDGSNGSGAQDSAPPRRAQQHLHRYQPVPVIFLQQAPPGAVRALPPHAGGAALVGGIPGALMAHGALGKPAALFADASPKDSLDSNELRNNRSSDDEACKDVRVNSNDTGAADDVRGPRCGKKLAVLEAYVRSKSGNPQSAGSGGTPPRDHRGATPVSFISLDPWPTVSPSAAAREAAAAGKVPTAAARPGRAKADGAIAPPADRPLGGRKGLKRAATGCEKPVDGAKDGPAPARGPGPKPKRARVAAEAPPADAAAIQRQTGSGTKCWSNYKGVTFHRHTKKWEAHSTSPPPTTPRPADERRARD